MIFERNIETRSIFREVLLFNWKGKENFSSNSFWTVHVWKSNRSKESA